MRIYWIVLVVSVLLSASVKGASNIPDLPQNGVRLYSSVLDAVLPEFSILPARVFSPAAIWCQTAYNNSLNNTGEWYYPSGIKVDAAAKDNSFTTRVYNGQTALIVNTPSILESGIYMCVIRDETGFPQNLSVGLYSNDQYDNNDGPYAEPTMAFLLISNNIFTLSFIVTNGPPTTVSCTVDGTLITNSSLNRVFVYGSVTQVTLTVISRQAGNYECTVSNDRVGQTLNNVTAQNSTSSLQVTIADVPTGLTITGLDAAYIKIRSRRQNETVLSWSPVNSSLSSISYEVLIKIGTSDTLSSVENTTLTSYNITDQLYIGGVFTFYVIAHAKSTTVSVLPSDPATIVVAIPEPPSVETELNPFNATNITQNTLALIWSLAGSTREPIVFNVLQVCKLVCESTFSPPIAIRSITSPYNVTNLSPYSECQFYLMGDYEEGQKGAGLLLAQLNVTTNSSVPTLPVNDVTISSVEARSMIVSWNEVPCTGRNGPIDSYYLTYTSPMHTYYHRAIIENQTHFTLTGLIPYTNYTVTVRACNDRNGLGPAVEIIQQTKQSIPGPVTYLSLTRIGPSSISVLWYPPIQPNGIITQYDIWYNVSSSSADGYISYHQVGIPNTQFNITGLKPNSMYIIKVRAHTIIGPGVWTVILVSTTNDTFVLKDFSAHHDVNYNEIHLIWSPVISATSYTVYYSNDACPCLVRNKTILATTGQIASTKYTGTIIDNLDNGIEYQFTVVPKGEGFQGERSQQIKVAVGAKTSPNSQTGTTNCTTGSGESHSGVLSSVGLTILLILLSITVGTSFGLGITAIILYKKLKKKEEYTPPSDQENRRYNGEDIDIGTDMKTTLITDNDD